MDDIDIDDRSFKKPGAVPFKWEIRPGVPKVQQQEQSSSPFYHLTRSLAQQQQQKQESSHHHHRTTSAPNTPVKLSPPPAGFSFQPPTTPGLRSSSSRSTPRTRTVDHCRFGLSILAQPEIVASGCFPTPLILRRKDDKMKSQRRIHRPKPEFHAQSDYTSDLETLSRWSASTRKSLSPFRNSPSSSSFSSYQSSPRPVTLSDHAEWAGFGLF